MCALETLSAVMPVLSPEVVSAKIMPTVLKACTDRIPNVKFCVCRIIKANRNKFDNATFADKLVPKLRELSQEADKDVAYFATLALQDQTPE